ncbi:MAG: bacitracin transporter ATP-binding protein [Bacilli bacterium]|nr:bacitracin transporter ATP-binding protein [Bacilli bacterium]
MEIPKGTIFGLLGPNGAGKTTIIRMMVGLMSLTEGEILINSYDITSQFEQAIGQVGAIVENPELYKFLTGYDNLLHFSRMHPDVQRERIREVVSLVGLDDRIHDKVKTYSLGMRQRLGLAQALLHRPSVIILDEPTNGLDPAGIRELRDHLRFLAKSEGITVVVSSHLLSEMELMCDQVGILQHGKLIGLHSMGELISNDLTGQIVLFDVEPIAEAEQLLVQQKIPFVLNHLSVQLNLSREQIAQLNDLFVNHDFKVYGIRTLSKTLEDTFLEMTGGSSHV